MSIRDISKETGASGPVVRGWLLAAGVVMRTISEAKKGQKPAASAVLASVRARRRHVLPGRPEVGYKVNADGYVMVWNAEDQKYEREHRLVLAKKLGRPLRPEEDPHHVNEVRHDNRPENLELKGSRAEHLREHAKTRRRVNGRFASA